MNTSSREKLLEQVQNDLKNISLESKRSKSMQGLREATEEAIVKVRGAAAAAAASSNSSSPADANLYLLTNQILYPLVQGCESKDLKVVKLCLGLMQRLVVHRTVDSKGARYVTDTLWMLMETAIEEVKILQTITLLLTSSMVVQHETLAKCLVICFRLNFTKDATVNTIAGATVRQLVPQIFERAAAVGGSGGDGVTTPVGGSGGEQPSPAFAQLIAPMLPKDTDPFVVDAYLMFQDIVLLVSADQPVWLTGIVEMTRSFGLELLESLLNKFPAVFASHVAFRLLLKERVCSLVIKLFSPNIKYKSHPTHGGGGGGGAAGYPQQDKPHYPITSKLLRVVSILVLEYHTILTTETEIFLSLVMKFLDPDKSMWQNCMALEVLHKIIVKPELLTFVCRTFDRNEHSTKVFQDIVNGLGAFVQNVMLTPLSDADQQLQQQQHQMPGSSSQSSVVYGGGPGINPQPGFFYRNVWKPLTVNYVGGQTKELFLELSERSEIPSVSDGYGISLAYACILDIVRSMNLIMGGQQRKKKQRGGEKDAEEEEEEKCWKQMVDSSWCGILAPLSLLLDASTDDSSAESILKAMETYASLCGELGMAKPRDAYLASLCKASLPPHYTLNVLKATACTQRVSGPRGTQGDDSSGLHGSEFDIRHQVVAVGTPLPTSSLPASAHQGPVMLTAKNLQCMRAILSVAHCHGNMLGNSWNIILTTLQHLVWILGLKPVAGGGLASTSVTSSSSSSSGGVGGADNNSVITTTVMADLPVLSNMVTRLFESSGDLSESSVNYLIEALCRLSDESMELANSNREPSLFAVAKLLETAVVNLFRIDVIWRSITSHLLLVCQHPHLRMRQWGSEAITFLIRQALQHVFSPPLRDNSRLQLLILSPLVELCSIPYPDVRQKQLDTVLHILHGSGEALNQGWPLILNIVGSIERSHSDILIRSAFQCLQLVFTDFLPTIPYRCYPQCVESATKFGCQETELNVSLTAVGLLWNLSDYFFQNVKSLKDQNESETASQMFPDFPGCKNISAFDKLWMCLYYRLKDLCLDSRPAVRKSAGQTLFSTIAAHGSVLEANTWQAVLWQVLFPLLDNVIIQSDNASTEKDAQNQVIMIHHSRNTAQKQWAETKVLTISGVVRVFNTKRKLLKSMKDYSKAWLLLLEYVEKMALSDTTEVSLAALKSMHEMIVSSGGSEEQNENQQSPDCNLKDINWTLCWKAWLNIGMQKSKVMSHSSADPLISQATVLLTGFIQIFICLFPHVERQFRPEDAESLGSVLLACVQVPIETGDMEGKEALTPVHAAAMEAARRTERVALADSNSLVYEIFEIYFKIAAAAFTPRARSDQVGRHREKLSLLGEVAIQQIGDFFMSVCDSGKIIPLPKILHRTVEVLHAPLGLKYQCLRDSNWRASIHVLIRVLKKGIPLARAQQRVSDFAPFWTELSLTLEQFLFPESIQEQKQEEKMSDEAVDCHIIELLRDEILPYPKAVPSEFIRRIVILLNKGSIHSTMDIKLNDDCSGSVGLREDFAKQCFETLLDFSLLRNPSLVTPELGEEEGGGDGGLSSLTNKLAITSLLQRFKEVLVDAIEGEKLNRNIPLQRQKTAEIAFVLRAIATVISSMKKRTAQRKVDSKTWQQVISLYPYLVQCTETNSAQVSSSVKDALMEYHDLLKPID